MRAETRTLAVIRTHRWDEDADRLCAQLRPVFGDDLAVVFHDRPDEVSPPVPVADIDRDWLLAQALRVVPDWGWRCGDYFLYRARQAFPDYDRYWLIEPDILFTGPVADFFAEAASQPQDVLGAALTRLDASHKFARGMPDVALYRSIFALVRFSGRAIDRLADLRRDYGMLPVPPRFFTNDEIFCFSHAMAAPDLTCASLAAAMPGWIDPAHLATDPDILFDLLEARTDPGVFHPVRGRQSFMRAVAARVANNTHFLGRARPSLLCLTEQEIRAIADDVGRRCLDALMQGRTTLVADVSHPADGIDRPDR